MQVSVPCFRDKQLVCRGKVGYDDGAMRYAAYILAQLIWGLPQTLAGFAVFLSQHGKPRFLYHGAIVTVWNVRAGLSLGPFVFVNSRYGFAPGAGGRGSRRARTEDDGPIARQAAAMSSVELYGIDEQLLVHEYGHTVQSLILGPLYLFVIGLPSVVWLKLAPLSRWRRVNAISYYTFYTERWANSMGERVLGRPSMGMAHID